MKRILSISLSAVLLCQCAQQLPPAYPCPPAAPLQRESTRKAETTDENHMPARLCYLDEVIPGICVDLKYCGYDNFVGRPIDGYTTGRRAILRRDTADRLARAQQALAQKGLALKVWDAYRPHRAMQDFYKWSRTPNDTMKAEFYPNITKQGIYENRYISRTSDHSKGLAVDVTLIRMDTGEELDMGGRHDLLDESSATRYPGLTQEQQANRLLLLQTMADVGLRNYRKEWWHYFQKKEPAAPRYNFPLNDNLITEP